MDRRDVEHGQLPKAFSHIGTALALAALDLGVKAWAEHALADGRPVDLGLLQLRLLFNPSNLADRAADGVVTDYLHTGWFPTFNGADVFITGWRGRAAAHREASGNKGHTGHRLMRGCTVTTQPEEVLVRRGLALAWFIVLWDVIEGVVAVTAGLAANSIALIGFGIDSAIEVFAASVVIPTGKDFRQSEMLGACDSQRRTLRTGVAEGPDGLAGALGSRSRVRSAVEVTSTSATGRSSKRSATASICCGFARPRSALRRVRAVPGARAARCTPSRPAIRSCVSPRLYPPMGCVGLSAGQPVELADLLIKGPGGDDAAQRADACRPWAGGVPQLRLRGRSLPRRSLWRRRPDRHRP